VHDTSCFGVCNPRDPLIINGLPYDRDIPGNRHGRRRIMVVRRNSTKEELHQTTRKFASRRTWITARSLRWILLGLFLSLLLLGHGIGAEWPVSPGRQPTQLLSKVSYDAKLTDPFFESNEWSCPSHIIKHPDGHFESTVSGVAPEKEPPRVKHTARCFITRCSVRDESDGSRLLIASCKAKFHGVNTIDLFIYGSNPADIGALRVRIRNGMFASQYWTLFKQASMGQAGVTWTTTRQKLILDRKAYRKGDIIKGRINFECVEEPSNPRYVEKWGRRPITIRINGVLKTRVE
jgi:hypothetical protein